MKSVIDAEAKLYAVSLSEGHWMSASESQLMAADAPDDADEINRLRQDNADLRKVVVRLSEDAEVWQRLQDWRAADRTRIIALGALWCNELGPVWSVEMFPGMSTVMSRAPTPEDRKSAYFDFRNYAGTEGRNATLVETVRAALDLYQALFPKDKVVA